MTLIPVGAEFRFVQDTAPGSANAGDVWLDTSVNPPVAKIYADVGNGLEWLQDQSSDRIETNLDAPVSQAGQGVDWASKTVGHASGDSGGTAGNPAISISGSGYVLSLSYDQSGSAFDELSIVIDGEMVANTILVQRIMGNAGNAVGLLMRFSSSFEIVDETGVGFDYGVTYALD